MRAFATTACLCAVIAVVGGGVATAAGPDVVHGHGLLDTNGRIETFSFAAVLDARGVPHGYFDYVLDAGTPDAVTIRGKVTCLRVIGTTAVIGGEITFARPQFSNPLFVGMVLSVVDGDAGASSDRFGSGFTAVSHLTCPTTLGNRPITDGEITVRRSSGRW